MTEKDFRSFLDVFKNLDGLNKRIVDIETNQKFLMNTVKHIERFLYYQDPFMPKRGAYQPELFSDDDLKQPEKEENLAENLAEWLTGFVDAVNDGLGKAEKNESVVLDWQDIIEKLVKAVKK